MLRFIGRLLVSGCVVLAVVASASADTLQDALSLAYQTNPTIRAERERLNAIKETKAQAWAGALPQVSASGSYSRIESDQELNFGTGPMASSTELNSRNYGVSAEQRIFTGFRNFHAIKQAKARIRAGGAQLIATEQQILRDVAAAYFSVQSATAVYDLNRKNVDLLLRQQEMANARFRVGEITKTDVAQADARLAGARANLSAAQGSLAVARSEYSRLVGQSPGNLEPVTDLPELPDDQDTALSLAQEFAPAVVAAGAQLEASERQVKIARGALMPSVSLTAGWQRAEEPSSFVVEDEQFAYGARATMPLFLGGANYSRVREAKALAAADRSRIAEAERQVAAQVTAAWQQLISARAIIMSAEAGVDANRLALEGVRRELEFGARTTLDVLDAEREMLNAEVALVQATTDAQTAAYSLLAAMGLLTPEAVGVSAMDESLNLYQN
ncbi:MAG: TolC family outer membrane protein [Marinicaulis sp.]|nr:TolC family outer membrane protein [Marinicaulis sp.]NNE41346.1 TolC family outer membrane protein [Marinicaulis sp.]NNL87466.1 TolC family outer membrane protein [Marinicaulis sp.]